MVRLFLTGEPLSCATPNTRDYKAVQPGSDAERRWNAKAVDDHVVIAVRTAARAGRWLVRNFLFTGPAMVARPQAFFADLRRSSHCLAASSKICQAARSLSSAACLIDLTMSGDIIVRNCTRSPSGDLSLRFGAFFFSTILSPGAARFVQKRPTRCGRRQEQMGTSAGDFPNFPFSEIFFRWEPPRGSPLAIDLVYLYRSIRILAHIFVQILF
jgi:hypothetical protein